MAQYLFDKLVIFDIGGDQVQVEKSGHSNDETGCSIGYKPVVYVVRSISTFPLYPYPRYRNGYLAFSTLLIDGIENKIDPGDPLDKDIYGLPEEELAGPGALRPACFL